MNLSKAAKCRTGQARARQSDIINHAIKRNKNGEMVVAANRAYFTEIVEHKKTKYCDQWGEGTQ